MSQALLTLADAIKTAVEVLDNAISGSEMQVDIVTIAAGDNNIGNMDVVTLPAELSGPGSPVINSYTNAVIDLAADTANQSIVAAGGANTQIWVYGLFLRANGATVLTIQDEDDTAHSGAFDLIDGGVIDLPVSGNFAMPWIKVATNKALEIDLSGATTTVDGIITYAVVDVS